ncbi:oxidoreductase [Viridothelium virens]|uniref:2,4-dienoyl-CoA reductase [(3E)-enoyl-CoA-producing] n=1 Tax=Viridothelium virens TaxID=1048519 RepID=A0A6A6HEF0_VIRVR|nr:oxidoreductase [Viridothelium virens]
MAATSTDFISEIWRKGIFENKVVFCTGGSGDICSAQVMAIVHLGANACIVGRNKDKAERVANEIATTRPGSRVLAVGNVDVRKIKDLEDAATTCVRELGSIDFVIAGAAGNFLAPFLQLSTNAFRAVVEIDLMGAWNTAKLTVPYLLKSVSKNKGSSRLSGRIIFISSTNQYTGTQLVTHGAVAKSGIDTLSAQLAIELGPRGLTSNVIAPGPISGTEGTRRLVDTGKGDDRSKRIPLGRYGSLKDMGNAVIYLFSEAGDYVTGSVLVVDGAAWRTGGGAVGGGFEYPETVLSDKPFSATVVQPKI